MLVADSKIDSETLVGAMEDEAKELDETIEVGTIELIDDTLVDELSCTVLELEEASNELVGAILEELDHDETIVDVLTSTILELEEVSKELIEAVDVGTITEELVSKALELESMMVLEVGIRIFEVRVGNDDEEIDELELIIEVDKYIEDDVTGRIEVELEILTLVFGASTTTSTQLQYLSAFVSIFH